jgi:hypothetical protein
MVDDHIHIAFQKISLSRYFFDYPVMEEIEHAVAED